MMLTVAVVRFKIAAVIDLCGVWVSGDCPANKAEPRRAKPADLLRREAIHYRLLVVMTFRFLVLTRQGLAANRVSAVAPEVPRLRTAQSRAVTRALWGRDGAWRSVPHLAAMRRVGEGTRAVAGDRGERGTQSTPVHLALSIRKSTPASRRASAGHRADRAPPRRHARTRLRAVIAVRQLRTGLQTSKMGFA
jgi:hypothetical protein